MNRDDNYQPWWDRAACKNTPPDQVDRIFFPGLGKHGSRAPKLDEPAKLICTGYIDGRQVGPGCPVRLDCLRWAIDHEILLGTYGGIPDHQRRKEFHHGARTDRGKTA